MLLTCLAILVAGYHSGVEDDAIYLPALKKMLDPALFPHDALFFTSQTKVFVMLRAVAFSSRLAHIPLQWMQLLWHLASIFLLVAGAWYLAERCFDELRDRVAGVALVCALLTMPVAGTSLFIADQYLHPRTLACAAILFATGAVLERRSKLAIICSLLTLLVHPLMAAFGIAFLIVLALPLDRLHSSAVIALATLPLPIIARPNAAWREAALTRSYFFLWQWRWYEWLGIFAPMALLWWFSKLAEKSGSLVLARFCQRLVLFSVILSAAGMVVGIPAQLDWLAPIQPMRHLQLVYLLMILTGGGLFARHVLQKKIWRWLLVFVPLCAGMFFVQRQSFSSSAHIEIPGEPVANRWVQCFGWVRQNTPPDAYFAVDPAYMNRPNEDNYGFRAIAERSKLADYSKDAGVVAVTADLAPAWKQQVDAMRGYQDFRREDFLRLKKQFGIGWALVEKEIPGLSCPYRRDDLYVCRIE
jgi:hypothetical protein